VCQGTCQLHMSAVTSAMLTDMRPGYPQVMGACCTGQQSLLSVVGCWAALLTCSIQRTCSTRHFLSACLTVAMTNACHLPDTVPPVLQAGAACHKLVEAYAACADAALTARLKAAGGLPQKV
jgi:hypothetical protein